MENLPVSLEPAFAINQSVIWSSSNENVAIVDDNGLVTAVSAGKATISVTTDEGGFTATSVVTVKLSVSTDTDLMTVLPADAGTVTVNYRNRWWCHWLVGYKGW